MLDECGCCEGISPETPRRVANELGLGEVAYRVGTHARFLESMLSGLSTSEPRPSARLRTRDPQDPGIAFLDACATVDDVLTFYQERMANETYLSTARERVSLVQLARQVGREPRPGVAAEAHLAFSIENTPGSPESTIIPAATKVQSIPGPGELPQTYETSETITARATWNAMGARSTTPQRIGVALASVVVVGIDLGIRRGDRVLVIAGSDSSQRAALNVQDVRQDPAAVTTTLTLAEIKPSNSTLFVLPFFYAATGIATRGLDYTSKTYSESALNVYKHVFNIATPFFVNLFNSPPAQAMPSDLGVYVFRQRAGIFGHNAPRWQTLPQIVQDHNTLVPGGKIASNELEKAQYPTDWDDHSVRGSAGVNETVDLDNVYAQIVPGSWVALEDASSVRAYFVKGVKDLSRSDFAISAKVSRLTVDTGVGLNGFSMRGTTVHAQSERLTLARVPVADPVRGNRVVLDRYYPGLEAGRAIVLSGRRRDLPTLVVNEARTLTEVTIDGTIEPDEGRVFTTLAFDTPLDHEYVPASVRVNGNVVLASHGESKMEVLGGGDASRRYQTFALKQPPLTYTSAKTPTGGRSSLLVRVNDVAWQEADTLFGLARDERKYIVRVEDNGTTRVVFNGALPSGQENVKAWYRSGIGLIGRVKADQLTLLSSRPLGVREVTNPLPASGGEDRESAASLRRNAALHTLTLGRLVSLRDYEDFARGFSGFAKAHATITSTGERQEIFVTAAPAGGGALPDNSPSLQNLRAALRSYGDPQVSFQARSWRPAFFQLVARVAVAADRDGSIVFAAIQERLREAFSFDARAFGQDVAASEVIAVIQSVPGVVFVDLDSLWKTDPEDADLAPPPGPPPSRLAADAPVAGTRTADAEPAEILMLDPRPVSLIPVTA